jgi:hypothetical protein
MGVNNTHRTDDAVAHASTLYVYGRIADGDGDSILMAWTARWRRDCLPSSLIAYRRRSEDRALHKWLDEWKAKFTRTPRLTNLQQLESTEDWTKLRNRNYGDDPILRLCDVGNKRRLAQHLALKGQTCCSPFQSSGQSSLPG